MMITLLVLAVASTSLSADPSASEFFDRIVAALSAGNYVLLGMLSVAVVVWLAEHFGPKLWATLGKPIPGAILALAMACLVAMINAGLSSAGLSLNLVVGALGAGFTAWGGPAKLIALFTSAPAPSVSR